MFFILFIYKGTDISAHMEMIRPFFASLRARGLREAKVHLAAGLPLTWLTAQKEAFRSYLLQNKEVEFSFNGIDYRVEFTGADIFPQGFAAAADRLNEFVSQHNIKHSPLGATQGDFCVLWVYLCF